MSEAQQQTDDDATSEREESAADTAQDTAAAEQEPASGCCGGLCTKLMTWLDDRTGIKSFAHEMLYERIPGGSRWRYVWGSTLVFAFVVQLITGIVLWMHYSPSDTTAWESVQYIHSQMQGGWLLRGIHHFMAAAMVVLMVLHLLQVVIDGAYKAPREVNFWLGLILMQIVLGLSLTGYLLPWDQKGYWATRVATNLMGLVPLVGDHVQQLVVGGSDYNHHTVTRFFALHAGVLPGLLVLFVAAHVAVFRRHGITPKLPLRGPDQYFWPDQVLKDGVACLAVMAAVLGLTIYFGGADQLMAPADGAREYSAARPEWYFLFLFQFLKLFEGWGHWGELVGAIVIPGLIVGVLFCMPFIARLKNGHWYNVGFLGAVGLGAVVLTVLALREDAHKLDFQNAKWIAHEEAKLAEYKALHEGIGLSGMRDKLRKDPQGIALNVLANECFKCHAYLSPDGVGYGLEKPSAPNLFGFGTAAWAEGMLDAEKIVSEHYFGGTNLKKGEMAGFVKDPERGGKLTEADRKEIAAALAAEADDGGNTQDKDKRLAIFGKHGCVECHKYHTEEGAGEAPTLDGWGSTRWLAGMITNPSGEGFYGHLGKNQQMPAFGKVKDDPQAKNLDPEVIKAIATWLRGEWYREGSH
jgi:ubiquinol-cytochrome c reductase cytochrome b subunit